MISRATKKEPVFKALSMVPKTGLEPVRMLLRGILSFALHFSNGFAVHRYVLQTPYFQDFSQFQRLPTNSNA
jgi:hypothetical protein